MERSRSVSRLPLTFDAEAQSADVGRHHAVSPIAMPASTATSMHRRNGGGMLAELGTLSKRMLKATSVTLAFTFNGTTKTKPRRARPKPEMTLDNAAAWPAKQFQPPRSLGRKLERNIDTTVPQPKFVPRRADIRFGLPADIGTPEGAQRYIQTQWKEAVSNGRFEAAPIERLAATLSKLLLNPSAIGKKGCDGTVAQASSRAILVSDALARATHGDPVRALAALSALIDNDATAAPQVKGDVLALQIALGTSGIGIETLLAIAPHTLPSPTPADSAHLEIQREAFRQALRAAEVLLARKPAAEVGPTSLEALAAMSDAVLPIAERTRSRATRGNRIAPAADAAPPWLVAAPNTLAIKALHAANILRADPAADCPRPLAEAYFAWRNGFEQEGPGTDLSKTRHRLFKFLTYADRSANTSFLAQAASGFFGIGKSPLSALQNFGTNGLMLRQPGQEFARFSDALAPVKARLVDRLKDSTVPRHDKMQFAVKLAALEQWHQRMATKGLRSPYRFSSSDLKAIAVRARALTPNRLQLSVDRRTADLEGDRLRNIEAIQSAISRLGKMTPWVLWEWAEHAWRPAGMTDRPDSGGGPHTVLPDDVAGKLGAFAAHFAELRPKRGDSAAQLHAIDEIVKGMPDTYYMRLSSGGTYGLASVTSETLAALSSRGCVPSVSVLPDVGAIEGRHAVVDIGSDGHSGRVFVGTDSRRSTYLGIGGFAGWSLGRKGLAMLGISGGVRRSRTTGGPCGVTLRTRRSDNDAPDAPDAWRTTMLDALTTLRCSGPNSDRPRTAEEMWSGLAERYWKDPALSVNWSDSRNTTTATSGSFSATARIGTRETKWGLSLAAGLTVIDKDSSRVVDRTGNHKVETASTTSGRAVPVVLSVVEGLPGEPLHHAGHLAGLSFPSAPYVGVGTTLFATNTNAALRIARDGDRIVARHTFSDTEFGTFAEFKQYVDHHRAEWLAALGGGEVAERKLAEMMIAVNETASAGNVVLGERREMTDEASARLDFLFHLKERYERVPVPTVAEVREWVRINADIRHMLGSDSSWRKQSLYAMESLGAQRTVGLSFLLNAQSVQSVSGVRELAVLGADRG